MIRNCYSSREKEMQEYQMEMKAREELKTKKLEEKANSMKSLMLQAELKRKVANAQEFRRKQLLIRFGFSPWIRFLEYWRFVREINFILISFSSFSFLLSFLKTSK